MTAPFHDSQSRREFLRSCVRWPLLAGLLALSGAAARRDRRDAPGRQTCVGAGVCGACAAYPHCGLPQALSRRRARGPGTAATDQHPTPETRHLPPET